MNPVQNNHPFLWVELQYVLIFAGFQSKYEVFC